MLLLVALLALASGSVMATAAGARRASTSYDRLLTWSHGVDALTGGTGAGSSEEADAVLSAAARLPQVESTTRLLVSGAGVMLADGRPRLLPQVFPIALDMTNPVIGRVKVLRGRLPHPSAVNEAAVGFVAADVLSLHVGDVVKILLDADDVSRVEPVTVTAIIADAGGFPSLTGRPDPIIYLNTAFREAHPEVVDWTNGTLAIRLRGGARSFEAFTAAADAANLHFDNIASAADGAVGVRRLVSVEARALWLLGGIFGATALVVLAQIFRRSAALVADQLAIVGGLGMSRRDLVGAGIVRGVRVGALGALAGSVVAVACSPLLPVGVSRTADPHLGLHADLVVIGIGVLTTLLFAMTASAVAVGLATRRSAARYRPARRTAAAISRLDPVTATGARMALGFSERPMDRRARSGLLGGCVAVAMLVATMTLGTSLHRLLGDPRLAGGTWDVTLVFEDAAQANAARAALGHDPTVAATARGGWGELVVNGTPVYGMLFEPDTGIAPAIDRGRAPAAVGEIALGAGELSRLHVAIGDTVRVGLGPSESSDSPAPAGEPVRAVVTGRSVLASPVYRTLKQGEGGAITTAMLDRLGAPPASTPGFFVRLRHPERLSSAYPVLTERLHPDYAFTRPDNAAVASLRRITGLVDALLGVLAALAVVTIVHRIVVTSRRHRRHLATLRSLGFTPSQVRRSELVQGGIVAVIAGVAAIPIGIVAGRVAWRQVADYLGVVPRPIISPRPTAGVALMALVIGAAVGGFVGARNSRVRAGSLLRTE
ncbi:MAG: hypothetical protein JWO37_849 [Acidimicrobiales bacterium]|jgi:hypothetical protein|nr:hypothetical protein [Acidimicrobiales bacterium]